MRRTDLGSGLGRWARKAAALLVAVSGLAACSAREQGALEDEELRSSTQAVLSSTQARVLGFESSADWKASSGSISASTTKTQGSSALGIVPNGWTEVTSIALSSLASVRDKVTYDLRVPQTPTWGETRVIIQIPSKGITWADLGQKSLTGFTAGTFKSVEFAIPAAVKTALSGTYTDLTIKVVVNAPTQTSPYVVDNLVLTDESAPPTPPGSSPVEFSVKYPEGRKLEETFVSTTDHFSALSQAIFGQTTGTRLVANFGSFTTYFQSQAGLNGDLYSVGPIQLDVKTVLNGAIYTKANISEQGVYWDANAGRWVRTADAPKVSGGVISQTVTPKTLTWKVDWPTSIIRDYNYTAEVAPADVAIDPGSYGNFVFHRHRVFLKAGTYYLKNFDLEPASELHLDTSAGPVIVYVQSNLNSSQGLISRAAVFTDKGSDGQMLLGFLGDAPAIVEGPFSGTLVAPRALIQLSRPNRTTPGPHRGAFFAKSFEGASSNILIQHIPFGGWDKISCPSGDSDDDGVTDCDESCPMDSAKTRPGVCGCGQPEADSDGDGVPDCIEACKNDPSKQVPGSCGCSDSPVPAGTPCIDERCGVASVCDGDGRCGSTNLCEDGLPEDCRIVLNDTRKYLVCKGSVDYATAEQRCGQWEEGNLAIIDEQKENAFLASVLLGQDGWVGGRATSQGVWQWDGGLPFYSASGGRLNRSWLNWAKTGPETSGCLELIAATGAWKAVSCTTKVPGYVCETRRDYYASRPPRKITDEDFYGPGAKEFDVSDICVPASTVFVDQQGLPLTDTQALYYIDRCATCGDQVNDTGADGDCQYCTGALAEPVNEPTCSGFDASQRRACTFADPAPGATPCTSDYQCSGQEVCGAVFKGSACSPGDQDCYVGAGSPDSSSTRYCGVPLVFTGGDATTCASADTSGLPCAEEPWVCARSDKIDTSSPLSDPETNLTPEERTAEEVFGAPRNDEETVYAADPACPDALSCGSQGFAHPWCWTKVEDKLASKSAGDPSRAIDSVPPGPGQPDVDNKRVAAGSGGVLRFEADPALVIDFNVTPKAFSEMDVSLGARGQFIAEAKFNFGITKGTVSIVDALAKLEAERCGVTTDVHLTVLGQDLLPALIDDPEILKVSVPDEESRTKCEKWTAAVPWQVNRVKKALRDAQELMRQYKQMAEQVPAQNFAVGELCTFVQASAPDDFPKVSDCSVEAAEDTINRFIKYYEKQINGAIIQLSDDANDTVEGGLAGLLKKLEELSIQTPPDWDIPTVAEEELWEIASAQFFLGPIPMTLQVEAFVTYGLGDVALRAGITPKIPTDGNPVEFAYASVSAGPEASAGIGLFVGAGFSAGPFEAAVGVSGKVVLGELQVPVHGRAGFYVSALKDTRPTGEAELVFPEGGPYKYQFELNYDYGMKVTIPKILQGSLGVEARVRFWLFSKKWKAELVRFDGFPVGSDEPFFEQELFSGSGTLGRFDWGLVQLPIPLVKLPTLSLRPAGTKLASDLDLTEVEDLFYDEQCLCMSEDEACSAPEECCPPEMLGYDLVRCIAPSGSTQTVCQYGQIINN